MQKNDEKIDEIRQLILDGRGIDFREDTEGVPLIFLMLIHVLFDCQKSKGEQYHASLDGRDHGAWQAPNR